jgi:hypothetical protein
MTKLFAITFCILLSQDLYAQTVYYPLRPGNLWQYAGFGPWFQVTVSRDTVLPSGKHYALLAGGSFQFLRQDSNQIYEFIGAAERLLFDFSRSPGDTVNSIPGTYDTTDIILLTRDSVNLFGRSRRHWVFGISGRRPITDASEGYDIVDSIGITALSLPNGYEVLQSALIDGRLYQTTGLRDGAKEVPTGYSLFQNYPNPFNPSTRISFSLPSKSFVSLKVFDVLGREEATVVSEELAAGTYTRQWNASSLPSGIYFYHLQAGSFSETKKCILLK